MDINELKKEINNGKHYDELTKIFNCSLSTIKKYAKIANVKVVHKICNKNDSEVLLKVKSLIEAGETNRNIAKKLHISPTTALKYTRKLGLKTNSSKAKSINYPIKLTAEQKEIIYGSMLGDMGLYKTKNLYRFSFCQGGNHEEYFDHVISKFSGLIGKVNKAQRFDSRTSLFYNKFSVKFLAAKEYEYFYKIMTVNDKKTITKEWVNLLTERSIAYWFMDDGSKDCIFATNCFSFNEVKLLSETLLNKFKLKNEIKKIFNKEQYIIHISVESQKRFNDLIRPYIVESMKYKLKYH